MAHNGRTSGVKSIYELIKENDERGVDKMGLNSNSNSTNGSVYIVSQVPKTESLGRLRCRCQVLVMLLGR